MQQTERCELSVNDNAELPTDDIPQKRPRKKTVPVKCPPDAYIQRITCPTRLQFYKNLLEQELAKTDKKINASRCSSKLHQEVRFKKTVAAEAHGDAPSRAEDADSWCPCKKPVKKTRVVRRIRHRKESAKYKCRDRSTSVEELQVKANVDRCETHCKVARKNSALYNIKSAETTTRPNLTLRKDEGKDRKVFHPGQPKTILKPHRRPSEVSALKKQVLKLSSSQIMHLDIKPKGVSSRRQQHYPQPLRKNIIGRTNRKGPHFVLFRRPSPTYQRYVTNVRRRANQCRRHFNPPVQVTTLSSNVLNNRGRKGSFALVRPPSNASSMNGFLQLCSSMMSSQKRVQLLSNGKLYTPANNPKPPRNQPVSKSHQPRVERRSPTQGEKQKFRLRSSSLQHASYYVQPNMSSPSSRNNPIPRQLRQILSTRSIDVNGKIWRVTHEPGFRYNRRKIVSQKPSFVSPGANPLRKRPSAVSRDVTSLRNRSSISGGTSLRDKPSAFSNGLNSLRNNSSAFSSGVSSLRDRPTTSYGATIHKSPPFQTNSRILQRPAPYRPMLGLNYLRVNPPVPSRAQTSIYARPQMPSQRTSMRDLLNNLKKSSQRNLNSLPNECPKVLNSMYYKNHNLSNISVRPLRRSSGLSSVCNCDVLPEKDEEEIANLERTASSNTTYSVRPEQCKLTSISTQTLICLAERTAVNKNKTMRA